MIVFVADGGGTKTRAWLAESNSGRVLSSSEAGASNIGRVGAEGLKQVLMILAKQMVSELQPDVVVLGLAGVGRTNERERAEKVVREVFPGVKVHVTTDAELAYRGAFVSGKRGILLIAGTGTIAFYQTHDREFSRAGGWGPLLGDEGGGVWLGREVLRHCLLEWEHDELSEFHAAVLERLGIENTTEILTKVYSDGFAPAEWAALAPLVFDYAHLHPSAERILRRMAIELVDLVERLVEIHLPEASEVPLVIMGGLWERQELLRPLIVEEIGVRNLPLIISELHGGPLEGGLAMAAER